MDKRHAGGDEGRGARRTPRIADFAEEERAQLRADGSADPSVANGYVRSTEDLEALEEAHGELRSLAGA